MATGKTFYWIKLKENFMQGPVVDFLMSQPEGANYIVLYLMLCMMTLKSGGELSSRIGEIIVPYDVEKIRRESKWFSVDTIRVALELFRKIGLVYEENDGILRLSDYSDVVGSETDWKEQKRLQREKKKLGAATQTVEKPTCDLQNCGQDCGQDCGHVHTEIRDRDRDRDKRLEIRDKDTREREKENTGVLGGVPDDFSDGINAGDTSDAFGERSQCDRDVTKSDRKEKKTEPRKRHGENGWVRLTDEEYNRLLADLGEEETERCIAYIDESAQITGNKNKWKDWNRVIRKCSREGWGKGYASKAKKEKPKFSYDYSDDDIDLPF